MTSNTTKVHLRNGWSVIVEADYEQIVNEDSWQAHRGDQTLYISTMTIKQNDKPVGADAIRKITAKTFGKGKLFSFHDTKRVGMAELNYDGREWQLKGFVCTDGNLATCVFNFKDERATDWALGVWESISQE